MNYQKFSAGLNISMATTLIIFEDISDAEILSQIVGRCQRHGRINNLEVLTQTTSN
jgi:CRISPR/Cas system-associated endonuclease/helicase Cas3